MGALDLAAFRATPLVREPFDYLVLPGFVKPEACAAINASYPEIKRPGSFPLTELTYGPAFANLVDELNGEEMRAAFQEKFGIDLSGRPTITTARGCCSARDGRIHTDTASKIITVLIYMNSTVGSPRRPPAVAADGRQSGRRHPGSAARGRHVTLLPPLEQFVSRA